MSLPAACARRRRRRRTGGGSSRGAAAVLAAAVAAVVGWRRRAGDRGFNNTIVTRTLYRLTNTETDDKKIEPIRSAWA